MPDNKQDLQDNESTARATQAMAGLKSIKAKPATRQHILAQMRAAHVAAQAAGSTQSTAINRQKQPLWKRKISLPTPAFVALLALVAWLGLRNIKPLFLPPNQHPAITAAPEINTLPQPSQAASPPGKEPSNSNETIHDQVVAFYIPTIGYVSRQETKFSGRN